MLINTHPVGRACCCPTEFLKKKLCWIMAGRQNSLSEQRLFDCAWKGNCKTQELHHKSHCRPQIKHHYTQFTHELLPTALKPRDTLYSTAAAVWRCPASQLGFAAEREPSFQPHAARERPTSRPNPPFAACEQHATQQERKNNKTEKHLQEHAPGPRGTVQHRLHEPI